MVYFFHKKNQRYFLVKSDTNLAKTDLQKLQWLFDGAELKEGSQVDGFFVGPRKEMITPWSTNAVEITQNMGIEGIVRIEEFEACQKDFTGFDPMISEKYNGLNQESFTINIQPEPILNIEDIASYNQKEGLALNDEEIEYLNNLSTKIGRKLTDSEVFGFSQVNSEHCRHKIFNGTFIIDGEEMPSSLFKLIRNTSEINPIQELVVNYVGLGLYDDGEDNATTCLKRDYNYMDYKL